MRISGDHSFGEAEITGTSAYANQEWLALLAIAGALVGIVVAYLVYQARKVEPFEPQLLADGWRYDSTISAFMGGPGRKAFEAIAWIDAKVVDGAVNGVARLTAATAGEVRRAQTGNVRNYAGILGVGIVLLLAWFVIGRGVW